jgi:hypothetical protein
VSSCYAKALVTSNVVYFSHNLTLPW